ncbi:MAG: DUF2147 domain-containing protein [Pseudomonadota bacterium]
MYRNLFSCLIILFSTSCWAANSPIGYWKTVDDVSGRVQSIIQIYETQDHTLAGKIVKAFPKPGVAPLLICNLCKGPLHGQPVLGMTILSSLKPEGNNLWSNGQIIDPNTGNIYHCLIKLIGTGDKLMIRGYILFHWLGRSQTWLHTDQI